MSRAMRAVAALVVLHGLALAATTFAAPPPASTTPAAAAASSSAVPASAPAPSAAPAASSTAAPDARRDEALSHFELGVGHFDRSEWAAALAEFLAARALYPTRSATKNAAICLRKENRFDEALDMFEALERDYPDLSPVDRTLADTAISELTRSIGTLTLRGSEPGASLVIDGRNRGTLPLSAPVRVSAGSHIVRVYKSGFAPFEQRVDVAGSQALTLDAVLSALRLSGRLQVSEASGKSLDVVVDNVVVGKSPWEGSVAPGAHTVVLRGEGDLGTQPASAPVTVDQITPVTLVASVLDSGVRIDPTPAGALVAVDGVSVGRGVWEGRLHAGAHRFEATADGFLPGSQDVVLKTGERQSLALVLDRDPTSPVWGQRARPHLVVDLQGAFALSPTLGSDLDSACTGSCSASLPFGGLGQLGVAYELPAGFGFGLQGGFLAFVQNIGDRAGTISGSQLIATDHGTLGDKITLSGLLVGGTFSYHWGDAWPLTLRIGVGGYLATAVDDRAGNFVTSASKDPPPNTPYSVTASESHSAAYVYAAPEIRVARRLGERLELGVGLQLLVLAAVSSPSWTDQNPVHAGPAGHQGDGEGGFGKQTLSGSFVFLVAPGVGARYAF